MQKALRDVLANSQLRLNLLQRGVSDSEFAMINVGFFMILFWLNFYDRLGGDAAGKRSRRRRLSSSGSARPSASRPPWTSTS